LKALSTVQEPELFNDLVSLKMIRDITISGDQVGFTIVLTTPACPLRSQMEQESIAAVKKLVSGVGAVNVRFDAQVRSDKRIASKLNIPVKNIIAVASGKGGFFHQRGGELGIGRRIGGRSGCRYLWPQHSHDVWPFRQTARGRHQNGALYRLWCRSHQHGLSRA